MPATQWKPLKNIDMNCFACGPENSNGLKMTFESNGDQLRSRVTVPGHLRGWNNLVHGGILSTICDEAMSWSAIHLTQRFILTKTMNVSFKKPALIETALIAKGYIKERLNERKVIMTAEIYDETGDLCASSEGEFVLFTPDQFRAMKLMPEELLNEMISMFKAN